MSKYKKYVVLSATALALMASSAYAATTTTTTTSSTTPAPVTKEGHGGGMLAKLDTNKDGFISKDEFLASASKHFDMMDINHDGKISKDEIAAKKQEFHQKMMERRAAHKDGAVAPATTPAQ